MVEILLTGVKVFTWVATQARTYVVVKTNFMTLIPEYMTEKSITLRVTKRMTFKL